MSGDYLSLAEAGKKLGMRGTRKAVARRLKRLLVAKERRIKKPIMLRLNGESGQQTCRVTLPLLRKMCPELFDRRDQVAEEIAGAIGQLREQISELFKRDDMLKEAINRLASRR